MARISVLTGLQFNRHLIAVELPVYICSAVICRIAQPYLWALSTLQFKPIGSAKLNPLSKCNAEVITHRHLAALTLGVSTPKEGSACAKHSWVQPS